MNANIVVYRNPFERDFYEFYEGFLNDHPMIVIWGFIIIGLIFAGMLIHTYFNNK